MKKILALSFADAKNIIRDSTLILVLIGPIALFVILRLGVPLITDYLAEEKAFDLSGYYLFIVSTMSMIPSMLFGFIYGFIILDERDEEIITFIAVTPLRKTGYLSYKLLASVIMSFLFFFVIVYLTELPTIHLKYSFALALMVALEAPIAALFLAAFAENKVEGMAFGKVFGIIYLAPFIAFFVDSNWKYFAGIMPPFWIAKTFIAANEEASIYWLFAIIGIMIHLVFITFLLKRFTKSQR